MTDKYTANIATNINGFPMLQVFCDEKIIFPTESLSFNSSLHELANQFAFLMNQAYMQGMTDAHKAYEIMEMHGKNIGKAK